MRSVLFLAVALFATSLVVAGEQQRILRRVIKSTPTATNLSRVRIVTTRAVSAEKGAVSEISSKEAANFGQRSNNEAASNQNQAVKTKQASTTQNPTVSSSAASVPTSTAPTTTSTTTQTSSTSTTTSIPSSSSTSRAQPNASERQQAAPQQGEVELLSGAPSSWHTMTAVEAPAAALIAAGTRPAMDLSSSSSDESSYVSNGSDDFLRSSSVKGNSNSFSSQSVGETFSRLRQQSSKKTQQNQQSFFYPQQQQQQRAQGKTSNYQASKTHWYQPTTSTTPRPAPIIQEQQQEQQYEQYVEQQAEISAPPGQAEPFAFDFKTQDQSGNGQYRKEESDKNGVVRGSYGYWSDGIYRQVNYIADENGFRASIQSNEPGMKKDAEAPASIELRS